MDQYVKKILSGWGRFPQAECFLRRPERFSELTFNQETVIPRGLGRSYGDPAINAHKEVILMERLNRLLSFDSRSGIVRAEAGISLEDILDVFVPQGWFLPVTPGTKYVTLGGCIAADIHGKNHHVDGTFSRFVQEIELILPDNTRRKCSPKQDPALFWAAVGGMGLTGIISEMTVQLIPIETAYMSVQHHATKNLDEALEILNSSQDKYSVAWIDLLAEGKKMGRSIIMNGRHASLQDLSENIKQPLTIKPRSSRSLPMHFPSWALHSSTISLFNHVYYWVQGRKNAPFITDYDRYFYPLDAISHWNRLYGKRGFVQLQFVIPTKRAETTLRLIISQLSQAKCASFLAVLKKFGKEGEGYLSFPLEGFTLALDIPLGNPELFSLLDKLDQEIVEDGGREYLAKDSRMSAETFRQMYPRFSDWLKIKQTVDPNNRLSSNLSRRLRMETAN